MIYEPSDDSFLLASQVKRFAKARSVLDIGSGSGIQAETATKAKAKSVLASDVDSSSITLLKSKGIPCVKSNLFSNVKGKFDLIVFNPPYLPLEEKEDKESRKATTGGRRGDEIILKFLKQAKSHLNPYGFILFLVSSLTPKDKINLLLKKLEFKKIILKKQDFFFESLSVWKICRH